MVNDYLDFIEWLASRLKEPLPGFQAQQEMMPTSVNGKNLTLDSTKEPNLGGVLLLLYPKNGEVYMPLMKRPEYDGVHSGQISFPGGRKEKEDADFSATALREGEEEVGIIGKDVRLLGKLSEHFITASNFKVFPSVGFLDYQPKFIPDTFEVEQVVEVSLNHLLDESNIKQKKLRIRNKYIVDTPYFDVHGHVVWGATAMMLSEFLSIIKSDYVSNS